MALFSIIAMTAVISASKAFAAGGNPMAPASFDLSTKAGDPVAMAMGGVYLLNLGGPQAGVYNPAQVNNALGFEATSQIGIQAKNVQYTKYNSLYKDFKAISGGGNITLNQVQNIYNDTKAASGTFQVQMEPMVGLALGGQIAIDVYSNDIIAGNVDTTGNFALGSASSMNVSAGILGLTTVAVPIAFPTPQLTLGIMPKLTYADYKGIGESIKISGAIPPVITYPSNDTGWKTASALDLDAGCTMSLFDGLATGAVAARHLISPKFDVPGYAFSLSPEFDAGIGVSKLGWTAIAEVHDITQSNGGSMTCHYGVQWVLMDIMALRAGYNGSQLAFGAGVHFGAIAMDLALDSTFHDLAGFNLSYALRF